MWPGQLLPENFVWTTHARTNVIVSVVIFERRSQEPPFKVWSNLGHQQLRCLLAGIESSQLLCEIFLSLIDPLINHNASFKTSQSL